MWPANLGGSEKESSGEAYRECHEGRVTFEYALITGVRI